MRRLNLPSLIAPPADQGWSALPKIPALVCRQRVPTLRSSASLPRLSEAGPTLRSSPLVGRIIPDAPVQPSKLERSTGGPRMVRPTKKSPRQRVPQLRGLNLPTLRSSPPVGRIIPDAPAQPPRSQRTFLHSHPPAPGMQHLEN